jgi:hypothetical protein
MAGRDINIVLVWALAWAWALGQFVVSTCVKVEARLR